jgi:hypothetical protein
MAIRPNQPVPLLNAAGGRGIANEPIKIPGTIRVTDNFTGETTTNGAGSAAGPLNQRIDPMTGQPYATPDTSSPMSTWNNQAGDVLSQWAPTTTTPDFSRNYLGMAADNTRPIERVGNLPGVDPNAFQLPGYAGIEYQAQTIGQRAGDIYGNALSQGNLAAGNAAQSRGLALNALTAQGPSAAELQLQAGQDANMRGALALARSGRGMGSGGQLRSALISGQQGMAQTNQQAAILRAQEEAQRRQQLLALGGQDLGALGQAYGQQLGAGQLGLSAAGQQAGLSQAQQQALADRAKLDAGMALDISKTNANFANYEQPAAPDNTWSDVASATGAAGGAAAGLAALGALFMSDERSKTQIQNLEEENAALRKSAEALGAVTAADKFAALPSYSYEYKQPAAPGAAPGTQVGPMAQDLEKVLPGAVQDTAQGKMVDTGRLSLANASATSELARRLAALEGKKPKREDLGTLPAMQVDIPGYQDLGTLPAMQVDIPRPQSRLAALGAR